VTRQRIRPAHTPEELARIYATPHDHRRWRDHHLRVAMTIEVARWLAEDNAVRSAADLSCGNGAILSALPAASRHFGDFAPGYDLTGPIEDTIEQIPDVDLYVCSETLEHLDDPDKVLKAIRAKTRTLVLSTPVDAWDDTNPEHYWAWSRADVEEMLAAAGFEPVVYSALDFRALGPYYYQFGIWGLR
jgi:hypothetical protein